DRGGWGGGWSVGGVVVDVDGLARGPAARLDLRLHRLEDGAGLGLEVAAMGRAALVVVGDLPGDVEDGPGAGDLHALRVGGRVPHSLGGVTLDGGHAISSDGW